MWPSLRLPEADIAIIDRAAALRGRSRTDFVRDAACRQTVASACFGVDPDQWC
jgi:uncharacterized protein (DUF1778 family)